MRQKAFLKTKKMIRPIIEMKDRSSDTFGNFRTSTKIREQVVK